MYEKTLMGPHQPPFPLHMLIFRQTGEGSLVPEVFDLTYSWAVFQVSFGFATEDRVGPEYWLHVALRSVNSFKYDGLCK